MSITKEELKSSHEIVQEIYDALSLLSSEKTSQEKKEELSKALDSAFNKLEEYDLSDNDKELLFRIANNYGARVDVDYDFSSAIRKLGLMGASGLSPLDYYREEVERILTSNKSSREKQSEIKEIEDYFKRHDVGSYEEIQGFYSNLEQLYQGVNEAQLNTAKYEQATRQYKDMLNRETTQLDYMNERLKQYLDRTSNIGGGITSGDRIQASTQIGSMRYGLAQQYEQQMADARATNIYNQEIARQKYDSLYDSEWKNLYKLYGFDTDTITDATKDFEGRLHSQLMKETTASKDRLGDLGIYATALEKVPRDKLLEFLQQFSEE